MAFVLFILAAFCPGPVLAQALAAPRPPWLEVAPAGIFQSRPSVEHTLLHETPRGTPVRANPDECSARTLEKETRDGTESLQHFFDRCGKILSRFSPTTLGSAVRGENFPIEGREGFFEVTFHLPFGIDLHGLLALKQNQAPRPWAVVICGTACNLGDSMAREALEMLFDETPFDVLVLPSVTGSDFIHENRILELGGLEEARQVYAVLTLLAGSDSPYRPLISSLHVLGMSLGGNSALFTGVYAGANRSIPSTGPQLQSIVAYCPAVDLEKSIDDLDRKDVIGRQYKNTILSRVREAAPFVTDGDYVLGTHQATSFVGERIFSQFQDLIAAAAAARPGFLLPPFTGISFGGPSDFWRANDFLDFFQDVKIPTLVLASANDFIVNPKNNALALRAKLPEESSIEVVVARKGWHCQMSEAYGEDVFTALIRGEILKHSPEFHQETRELNLTETFSEKTFPLDEGEKYFGYDWRIKKNKTNATLTVKIWTPSKMAGDTLCSAWSPYYAFEGCFRTVETEFPLNDFTSMNGPVASDAESEGLTRWFNSHVYLLTEKGREPVDTTDAPALLSWNPD